MDDLLRNKRDGDSIAVVPIGPDRLEAWRASAPPEASLWTGRTGFSARPGTICLVPSHGGRLACVLAGVERHDDPWALAHAPEAVPAGAYHFDLDWSSRQLERAALGWALAAYRFDRYKKAPPPSATPCGGRPSSPCSSGRSARRSRRTSAARSPRGPPRRRTAPPVRGAAGRSRGRIGGGGRRAASRCAPRSREPAGSRSR